MPNPENLRPKPFTSENQPEKRGRPQGSKNRSTILRKWLTAELDITNPITRGKQRGTVEDEVVLALITKARLGDIAAIKEVLDTMYGRLTDKLQIISPDEADRIIDEALKTHQLPETFAGEPVVESEM